jgi:hypothetical protein
MIKPLLVIAIVIVLVLLVSEAFLGQFSSFRLISSKGNIQTPPNIGIYWDSNGANATSSIEWGSLEPGLTKNVTVYIANEGNTKVYLSLNTTNWEPANISRYMNLTWNYNGAAIYPDETIKVTFTLSAASSPDFINYLIAYDVKEFNFDIIINATR